MRKKAGLEVRVKTDLSALDDAALKSINSAISKVSFLLKDFSGGEFNLLARKYNKNTFYDEALGGAIISSVTGKEYNKALDFGNPGELEAIWRNWEAVAKDASKSVFEVLSEAAGTVSATLQSLKLNEYKSNLDKLKYQSDYALSSFKALGVGLGDFKDDIKSISEVTTTDLKAAYEAAIKADFSQQTIDNYNELITSYNSATEALKAYNEALKSFIATTYDVVISLKAAFGQSTTSIEIAKLTQQISGAAAELGLSFGNINEMISKFKDMSIADMQEFLKEDTENKTSFINNLVNY